MVLESVYTHLCCLLWLIKIYQIKLKAICNLVSFKMWSFSMLAKGAEGMVWKFSHAQHFSKMD